MPGNSTSLPGKLLKLTNVFMVAALATTVFATAPAQADALYDIQNGDAKCSKGSECIVAYSWNGNARCENATCVAIAPSGNAESGCWGAQCVDCEDDSCGFTECSGDFAVTCVALAVGGRSASAGAFCHWFTQTCWAVAVSPTRTTLYYCYGDLYDDYDCSGQI